MRRNYDMITILDMRGGIQQDPATAQANQVIDATNFWWQDGQLAKRPGFIFLTNGTIPRDPSLYLTLYGETADDYPVWIFEETDGTFTQVTMPSWPFSGEPYRVKNTRVYPQLTLTTDQPILFVDWNDSNTNATRLDWEYYNGTDWVPLTVNQYSHQKFLNYSTWAQSGYYRFQIPSNATNTTVDGLSRCIRFTMRDADLANATTMPGTMEGWRFAEDYSPFPFGLLELEFLTKSVYVVPFMQNATEEPNIFYVNLFDNNLQALPVTTEFNGDDVTISGIPSPTTSSVALKDYSVGYFSFANQIFQVDAQAMTVVPAAVENRPWIVGTVGGFPAIYNPSNVPQLGAFPQAQFVAWYQNQLFVFNTSDAPNAYRWSAPSSALAPGYAVWPNISYDIIPDNDNSPITGVIQYQEQLLVFKRDSIWQIVYNGQISSGTAPLNSYVPVRITTGVGCAAPNTIVPTPRGVFFVGENGAYILQGNQAVKITDPIDELFNSAQDSAYRWAVAAHSIKDHCVYLSLNRNNADPGRVYDDPQLTFPTNDTILVWDYKYNGWWKWEGISAVNMLVTEGTADQEIVLFANSVGSIFSLGDSDTDNGVAIEARVVTHRYGTDSHENMEYRELEVTGTNLTSEINGALVVWDGDQNATMYPIDFEDEFEAHVGTAIVGTATAAATRRRVKRLMFRTHGDWVQVKLTHDVLGEPCKISGIKVGYFKTGSR